MSKNGFTLLETLVVIFIIILFSTIITSGFSDARERLALRRTAHQLVQDLRRAQEMAMSSKQLTEGGGCSLPLAAQGYGIYIDISEDNKSYKLYADTAGDNQDPPEWEYYTLADCVVENINIQERGVIIKEILNIPSGVQKVSINFKPPNPNVKIKWLGWLKGDVNEVRIVLASELKLSSTATIVVNRAGMIEIE